MTDNEALNHLPERKRRELSRALKIIFEEFDAAQQSKLSEKQKAGRILKVILFGSYSRGGWVEDHKSGYRSDYDILVVVNMHSVAEENELWHDEAFIRIFAYFDRYQWHLDERPLRNDDEINPDVLGYIFDKGLVKSRVGVVLVTPALLRRLPAAGVADKELSALLATEQLVPIVHNTTYEALRNVSPLLASRSGLSTEEDTMVVVADKLAELVAS
ncbi:nucleotidyltransferase domain-containing protein [Neorhizobium sp. R1-B]|uniref:nucleotidyltransferase domain-containing protein n=1 Tax=Neorhizobium sp. R1-B TaxID=2485162 RepID=UPI001FDFC42A|nr:nucleotidyltransferase domain-containing protein [Neorhizobium sp. R1-B]